MPFSPRSNHRQSNGDSLIFSVGLVPPPTFIPILFSALGKSLNWLKLRGHYRRQMPSFPQSCRLAGLKSPTVRMLVHWQPHPLFPNKKIYLDTIFSERTTGAANINNDRQCPAAKSISGDLQPPMASAAFLPC
jgi:hypothetical protein